MVFELIFRNINELKIFRIHFHFAINFRSILIVKGPSVVMMLSPSGTALLEKSKNQFKDYSKIQKIKNFLKNHIRNVVQHEHNLDHLVLKGNQFLDCTNEIFSIEHSLYYQLLSID